MAPIRKEDFLKTRMKRRSNIFYQVEKQYVIHFWALRSIHGLIPKSVCIFVLGHFNILKYGITIRHPNTAFSILINLLLALHMSLSVI